MDTTGVIEEELRRSPLLNARIRSISALRTERRYVSRQTDPQLRDMVELAVNGIAAEVREARLRVHEHLLKYGMSDLSWLEAVVDCDATHDGIKVRDWLKADVEHLVSRVGVIKGEQASVSYLERLVEGITKLRQPQGFLPQLRP